MDQMSGRSILVRRVVDHPDADLFADRVRNGAFEREYA